MPQHSFSGVVEHALAHIEEAAVHNLPTEQQRWYAIKIFERDEKVREQLHLDKAVLDHIEEDIKAAEQEMDDDAESIITNERYVYIASIIKGCYKKKNAGQLSVSDKIDRVVTNRWAALPIFAVVMFIVYFVSVTTVGTYATDWPTTACSAKATTCLASVTPNMRKPLRRMRSRGPLWKPLRPRRKRRGWNPTPRRT